ncbi:hypothetical protein [Phyllobacterium myrsinacearum]|uniref:Uncharacterized protein n=1 Tax=Phyllobacterium myrsinacearum TaxID=28101 RepID=A0A839EJZ7_9HYPH|nr:hypothetical protein [Phyllobacterium myrsinacearum]MBA8879129.1 hypothetical protein [Phyllobacterium myrsinacearum]
MTKHGRQRRKTDDQFILDKAMERASGVLGRHADYDRVRSAITKFLDLGERDFGRLADMAVKVELSVARYEATQRAANTSDIVSNDIRSRMN